METNNIITAPQVDRVNELYAVWKQTHTGSLTTFYEFITTPSAERSEFIGSLPNVERKFAGAIASITISAK